MVDIDIEIKEEIISWLKSFSIMVRSNDYSNALNFFDPETFGFGTIASSYSNLEEYRSLQWQECWTGTKDFEFDYKTLKLRFENNIIILGILWSGIGIRPDGNEFSRDGRATIVLKRNNDGSFTSLHNHYSRTPKNFPQDF